MKILMTAETIGAVWTYALELSAALARHDAQIVLAILGPAPGGAQLEQALGLGNVQLECASHKLEWTPQPWADVERAAAWLREIAQRESVEVVHLNGYVHAAFEWARPVLVTAHSCMWSRWQAINRGEPPAQWSLYRERVAAGLGRASHVVAPTRAFLEQLRKQYPLQCSASVIHSARSAGFCTRTEPHKRQPVIFASERLWEEPRSVRVLDAAVRGLPWRAYVAGIGSTTAGDGRYIRVTALRCLDSLAQHDVAAWLKRAAIFVHPTRYEPSGLPVLEAALAGCALVLSDLPALRELWEGAALFVDPDDAAGFRRALTALIEDPSRRQYLSNASQERARQFRPDAMADGYVKLYRALLAGAARAELAVA